VQCFADLSTKRGNVGLQADDSCRRVVGVDADSGGRAEGAWEVSMFDLEICSATSVD
jgi:hypothetical protein